MMGIGRGGRTYKVLVEDLLVSLRENRENHVARYETARANFRKRAIERLDEMLNKAKHGDVQVKVGLTVPTVHTKEFDNAIGLLEMTLKAGEKIIEIDADEYERFVRNNWEWTDRFYSSTRAYVD